MNHLQQKIELLKFEIIDKISTIDYYDFEKGSEPFISYNGMQFELSHIKNGLLVFYNKNIQPIKPIKLSQTDLFTVISLIKL